jgi:hypothetical protein
MGFRDLCVAERVCLQVISRGGAKINNDQPFGKRIYQAPPLVHDDSAAAPKRHQLVLKLIAGALLLIAVLFSVTWSLPLLL